MTREERLEEICRIQSAEIERLTAEMNRDAAVLYDMKQKVAAALYWKERYLDDAQERLDQSTKIREMEGQIKMLRERNAALTKQLKDAEPGLRKRVAILREENALLKAARKPLKVTA